MNNIKTVTIKCPPKTNFLAVSSSNITDFVKDQKVIKELRTMYPNKSFWKAFKKLERKYFWIGAVTSAVACGATYFVKKKHRKKKFEERILKVQETYSEDPVAMALELVGVMQCELKGLGYHFKELDDPFEEGA